MLRSSRMTSSLLPAVLRRRRLSPEERAFADLFAGLVPDHPEARLDIARSAELAGLAPPWNVSGAKLLRRPHVWRAIDKRLAGHIAGPHAVLTEMSRLALAPDSETETRPDGSTVERRVDPRVKARMLELLGRRYGATLSPIERQVAKLLGMQLEEMERAREERSLAALSAANRDARDAHREVPALRPIRNRKVASRSVVDIEATAVPGYQGTNGPTTRAAPSSQDGIIPTSDIPSSADAERAAVLSRPVPALADVSTPPPWALPEPVSPRPRRTLPHREGAATPRGGGHRTRGAARKR